MLRAILVALLCAFPAIDAAAQTPPAPSPPADADQWNEVVLGLQAANNDTGSAKFNEYRDLDDGLYLLRLRYSGLPQGSRFLDLTGSNLGRDDQQFDLRFGSAGTFRGTLSWSDIPHRLSNDAFSPYQYQGNGLFTVPEAVGILTTAADNTNYLPADAMVNDAAIAAYLSGNLALLPQLGTARERGAIQLSYTPVAALELGLSWTEENKSGQIISYGPLGDRPPRTLNVELPEPTEYTTRDIRFNAGYAGRNYQVQFEFAVPEFDNEINTMRWQSMYFGPDSDGSSLYNNDVILAGNPIDRRTVSTFGQRPLPPSNTFQTANLVFGLDTLMSGRLTLSGVIARMEQDESLLPYSYSTLTLDWNSVDKLPRPTADAEITTNLLSLDYTFTPRPRWNVHAWARSFDLSNDTAVDQWRYVTSDAASRTGGVSYKNKRINVAYGYDRQNLGLESTFRLRRGTLGVAYEREMVDRDFRETETGEDLLRATASLRPLRWLSLRARYLFGNRQSDDYDWTVTRESYWYAPTDANDADNPQFAFVDHPDLRRFDLADRRRNQFDLSASLTPLEVLGFSVSYAFREDDFDSNVRPVQPMAGTSFASAGELTPGVQLGTLADNYQTLAVDVSYVPAERWSLTAFAATEKSELEQRGMGFNEGEKTNDQRRLIGNPGQSWLDPANYWFGVTDDRSNTVGAGFAYEFVPGKVNLSADYSYSQGTVEIDYGGYGSDKPLNTTYYAWRSPEDVEHRQQRVDTRVEYMMPRGFVVGLRYLFEDFETTDFLQEPIGGWAELVGSDYFVRDSTRDNRWGNRLVRLGGYLAPGYTANVGLLTLAYHW